MADTPSTGKQLFRFYVAELTQFGKDLQFAQRNVHRVVKKVMVRAAPEIKQALQDKFFSGRPGVNAVTGSLKKSIGVVAKDMEEGMKLEFSSDSPYFDTHFEGKTIFPVVARRLAIPMTAGPKRYLPSPKAFYNQFKVVSSGQGSRLSLKNIFTGTLEYSLVQRAAIPARTNWMSYLQTYVDHFLFPEIRDRLIDLMLYRKI